MLTEDYCDFETAKLLKDKGFDARCPMIYTADGEMLYTDVKHHNMYAVTNKQLEYYTDIIAPTLQLAMKWLREEHGIHIEICLYKTNEDDIEPMKSRKAPYYTFGVWDSTTGDNIDKRLTNDFIGDTYEQACEAAIKYCLENLI